MLTLTLTLTHTLGRRYVLGNVIALLATCFWVGPKYMCKKMWKRSRRCAIAFYLAMLITVFVLAIAKAPVGVILLMMLTQVRLSTLLVPWRPPASSDAHSLVPDSHVISSVDPHFLKA